MTQAPLIDPQTIRKMVQYAMWFGIAGVAIWIIGFAIKTFKKVSSGDSGGGVNDDGTPAAPPTDPAYIDRIAKLVKTARDDKDYSGLSSARCEATNNIIGMRNEEIVALIALCKGSYGFDLKGETNKWKGDGCFTIIEADKAEALKERLKNF